MKSSSFEGVTFLSILISSDFLLHQEFLYFAITLSSLFWVMIESWSSGVFYNSVFQTVSLSTTSFLLCPHKSQILGITRESIFGSWISNTLTIGLCFDVYIPLQGLITLRWSPNSCSSWIVYWIGEWCFEYPIMMWLSRGHSEGRNLQTISRLLVCQYSDSRTFSVLSNSFSWNKNHISVDTQKYPTLIIAIFSKNESLVSSYSSLGTKSSSLLLIA